jgi:hypothetical protein
VETERFGSDRMWGLKELPLPESISWFPATPGWLVIAALALAATFWVGWRLRRLWLQAAYRREALERLEAIERGALAIDELPGILRKAALEAFAREEVAALRGPEWVAWLNAHGGDFESEASEWLDLLPYESTAASRIDPAMTERLLSAGRSFVKGHSAVV